MSLTDKIAKHLSSIPDVGFGAPIASRHNQNGWMTEARFAQQERTRGYLPDSDPYSSQPLYARDDQDLEGEELLDISGLPYVFNPPLHNWNLPVWINQGRSEKYQETMDHWMREKGASTSLDGLKALRLGRISMGNKAQSFVSIAGGTRWGFRFLYNPETLVGQQALSTQVIPNPQEKAMWFLLDGLETIQLELLLNRVPDVNTPNVSHRDYTPYATTDDINQIKKRGTNWDLEFLFRCSNGTALTTADGQTTADFGLISPNPLYLTLGNMQFYGRITQIHTEHLMWSLSMIPILSRVTVSFMRVVALSQEDFETYGSNGGRAIGVRDAYKTSQAAQRESIGAAAADGSSGSTEAGDLPAGAVLGVVKSPYLVSGLDQEQSTIARHIVEVAMKNFTGSGPYGPDGKRAALIGLITAKQESQLLNLDHGHADSLGVFQQRPSQGWGSETQVTNVQYATSAFFGVPPAGKVGTGGLSSVKGWNSLDVTVASHEVQRSAHPNRPSEWIPSMVKVRDEILSKEDWG